jgi:hypothetical protein
MHNVRLPKTSSGSVNRTHLSAGFPLLPKQEWLEDEEPSGSWALLAPFRFNAFWWSFALAVFAGVPSLPATCQQ